MIHMLVGGALALGVACGDKAKDDGKTKAPANTADKPAVDGDAGAAIKAASDKLRNLAHNKAREARLGADGATKPRPKPKKLTAAQRKEFHRHLSMGRKLQKQKKWVESIAALDKALALHPTSDRALSEVSWSAFNSGDFMRAETAAAESVAYAVDPRVKAASLFNLGRALEKRNQKAKAIVAYQRSLRLRPNKIVKKRLEGLGGTVPKLVRTPACPRFQTTEQVCACLRKADPWLSLDILEPKGRAKGHCTPTGKVTGDLELLFVGVEDTHRSRMVGSYVLTQVKGDKRAVVASVNSNVHQSHKHEDRAKLGKVETKTIGGKKVVQVEIAKLSFTPDDYASAGWGIKESTGEDWLLFCVPNDGFLKCPVQVPAFRLFTARLLDPDAKDDFDREYGGQSPYRRGVRMDVTLGKDGTVTVAHGSGEKEPEMMRYVGKKKLW